MDLSVNEAAPHADMAKFMKTKLVRTKIAEKIKKEEPENLKPMPHEIMVFPMLIKKLEEELDELGSSDFLDEYEFADVLEVLETIMKVKKVSMKKVLEAKEEKLKKFGPLDLNSLYIKL